MASWRDRLAPVDWEAVWIVALSMICWLLIMDLIVEAAG